MHRVYSLIFVFAAIAIALCSRPAMAATADLLNADTLKAALHTSTPVEDGFIEKVVSKVNAGKLPLDLVQSTFLWARKKPLERRFYYFKQALTLRASQAGVGL
jgi:hypothetical protein